MKVLARPLKFLMLFTVLALNPILEVSGNDELHVPPFEQMLDWSPMQDRTMVVLFQDVSYRYEILSWGPSKECSSVVEVDETGELRWLTRTGWFTHEYFTRKEPVAYKMTGSSEWTWVLKKTSKQFKGE